MQRPLESADGGELPLRARLSKQRKLGAALAMAERMGSTDGFQYRALYPYRKERESGQLYCFVQCRQLKIINQMKQILIPGQQLLKKIVSGKLKP